MHRQAAAGMQRAYIFDDSDEGSWSSMAFSSLEWLA